MKGKNCKNEFNGIPTQKVCSYGCAIILVMQGKEKKRLKEERKAKKETRDRLKTKSDWLRDAQACFNKYIRLRDAKYPCISCGRHHKGQFHAGHYRTVGASPELRFNELNVHKQCAPCNDHLSGNIVNYRIGLIKKIGIEKVAWIEGPHEPKKNTIPEIIEIKEKYKQELKELLSH